MVVNNNSSNNVDFEKIRTFLKGAGIEEQKIIREPIKTSFSIKELKYILMEIGQEKCYPAKFTIDKNNKFAYENIFKWAIGDDAFLAMNPITGEEERGSLTKGLFICGPTGTGKTICLNIFRTFVHALAAMITIPGKGRYMLSWTTFFANDLCLNVMNGGDLSWLHDYPAICIQDIGSEVKTVSHFGTKSNAIEQVLQDRGEQNLLTMLTSNYSLKNLPYGDRVASRICKLCNYYEIRGEDRRRI